MNNRLFILYISKGDEGKLLAYQVMNQNTERAKRSAPIYVAACVNEALYV